MAKELTKEELFCLEGCRNYDQYYEMRQRFEQGRCSFCDLDRELNEVLFETDHVLVWEIPDQFKRPELAEQYLVVPKRHVRGPWELTQEEWLAIHSALLYVNHVASLPGGMIFARFDDMRYNAGTVPHLHWNVWVPARTEEVRVPIFKADKDRGQNEIRAAEFAAEYEQGKVP